MVGVGGKRAVRNLANGVVVLSLRGFPCKCALRKTTGRLTLSHMGSRSTSAAFR